VDVIEAIQKRRSIRRYKPDEIPQDILDQLLTALRLAPSGSNRQPWKFIVVQDKKMREAVAASCSFIRTSGKRVLQSWIAKAPVIIVACGCENEAAAGCYEDGEFLIDNGRTVKLERDKKPGEYVTSVHWDLAIALDHLTLAAVEEGLGTCWIGGINEPRLRELLSIPDDWTAELAMTIGYPVSWPDARPRKSLEEIICYDKYS
jgi:nitroreductase